MFDELKFPQLQAAVTKMLDDPNDLTDIYEYGLYEGVSLEKLYELLLKYGLPYGNIYAIDSFQGLPSEDSSYEVFPKFKEGSYKSKKSVIELSHYFQRNNIFIIKRWFKDLNKQDVIDFNMKPAKFIHIDCDLYISTKEALSFMFKNKLIVKGSLIAYDEFRSTEKLSGEELAHKLIMNTYNCVCDEVWRFVYRDKTNGQMIVQKLFEVISL